MYLQTPEPCRYEKGQKGIPTLQSLLQKMLIGTISKIKVEVQNNLGSTAGYRYCFAIQTNDAQVISCIFNQHYTTLMPLTRISDDAGNYCGGKLLLSFICFSVLKDIYSYNTYCFLSCSSEHSRNPSVRSLNKIAVKNSCVDLKNRK